MGARDRSVTRAKQPQPSNTHYDEGREQESRCRQDGSQGRGWTLLLHLHGKHEAAADWISQKFEGDISDPTDIGEIDVDDLTEYSSLIVGAPNLEHRSRRGKVRYRVGRGS